MWSDHLKFLIIDPELPSNTVTLSQLPHFPGIVLSGVASPNLMPGQRVGSLIYPQRLV